MAILSPFPKFRALDANGNPLAGGKLTTYEPGTLTPKATFTTALGITANANPVILNAQGEADVWLQGAYRWILTDAQDLQQWDIDNINAAVGLTQVFPNATQRSLTAAVGIPQTLQSDAVPALTVSPDRVARFSYGGQMDQTALGGVIMRVKVGAVELLNMTFPDVASGVWAIEGTLLMRDSGNAEVLYTQTPPNGATGIVKEVLRASISGIDLAQAFAWEFEAQRSLLTATVDLYTSYVEITG